jgi:hypothetical protein
MKYLDANIFIYAYFKPKKEKQLSNKLKWSKNKAKQILQDINDEQGNYCISLIQLSEVVNLLKTVMSWENLHEFIMGLISNKSINIVEISKLKYISAVDKMIKYNMDANDLSAYLLMKEEGIKEIYTFDHHFENLPEIVCLPETPKEF